MEEQSGASTATAVKCERRQGLIEEQVAAQKYRRDVVFAYVFVFI